MNRSRLRQARQILGSAEKQSAAPKTEVLVAKTKNYQALYTSISVGDCVMRDDRTWIVGDKFLNPGGIPQIWICWGVSTVPYPEYPTLGGEWGVQVLASCRLSDAPSTQRVAA
ncbi:MAG TPA: hypothetical protein V6D33_07240 [Cyanophyceae cyanobacterium]